MTPRLPQPPARPTPTTASTPSAQLNTTALPPIEKPAEAPDQVNEAAGKPQPATPRPRPGKKNPKPAIDKDDETSSKKKPKKGLDKLNPF